MKNRFLSLVAVALVVGAMPAMPSSPSRGTRGGQQPSWPQPQREAKAGSRWWWMGSAVTADGLSQNMREYARTGIGTLEITPIYGVQGNEQRELSFLGTGWMDALKQTQALGDELGIDIDMNCGTGWPFGGPTVKTSEAAGKLVTKTDIVTSDGSKPLTYNVAAPEGNAPLNKVMAYQGSQAIDVTAYVEGTNLTWSAPAGEWRIIAVYNGHTGQTVKRAAPGGEGLVLDHYDATAVANYLSRFDRAFEQSGARWPHAFFNDSYEVYGANWTPKMFDEFYKYRGYRLEDHLPELLGLVKDTNGQVIADYRQTLSDMLLNNFTIQWTNWAHSHGVITRNQGHGSPGNLLDFYAAVDIPEIESFGITDFGIRGLRTDPGFVGENLSDFSTLKYASSAAHVMGKPFTSSETLTWLTEHFRTSLSQMKPDIDLMFCAGVNHLLFHGTTYSPPEAAWPGWKFYASIDMSPTNSIWHDAPALMDYIERCQSFLQMGSPDNDLLVYAPFLDIMHKNTGSYATPLLLFDINTLSQRMSDLTTCVKNIEAAGLDCDYVSDRQLLDVTYANGLLVTAAGTRYQALVVPASKYMPDNVKTHLEELAAQGARIVWGYKAAQIAETAATPEPLRTELGLRVIRRSNDTGHHYFMANLSKNDAEGYVPLSVSFADAVWFYPMTGRIAPATVRDGKVYVCLRSGESAILQTYQSAVPYVASESQAPTAASPLIEATSRLIDTPWTLTLTPPHTYTLSSLSGWQTLDAHAAQFMGTGIYATTISLTERQLAAADAGFRLNLGDVRESARVYVNDTYMGCAWAAPFTLDLPLTAIHEGANTLRIEVTNLPANHIRQMDIDGTPWRIFKDVNILDVANGSVSVSGITSYASWEPVPSGLCSPVTLTALRQAETSLQVRQTGFATDDNHSMTEETLNYYPVYQLTLPYPATATITSLQAVDEQGQPYTGFTTTVPDGSAVETTTTPDASASGSCTLVIRQQANGYVCFTATATDGNTYTTYLPALGAYSHTAHYDFTSAEPPQGGWQTFTSQQAISGFAGTGKVDWCRSQSSGKQVDDLYGGLHFTSAASTYFFFYPGYGMNLAYDVQLNVDATPASVAMLSYLVGNADASSTYAAADSLVTFATCDADAQTIAFDLLSRSNYYIYRQLDVYRPLNTESAIGDALWNMEDGTGKKLHGSDAWYDLQGRRVKTTAGKGLYIRNGRKTLMPLAPPQP